MKNKLQYILLLTTAAFSCGFLPVHVFHHSKSPGSIFEIYGKYNPYDDSGDGFGEPASERNKARMDIRNFLTQRSIQSFAFLLNQCREDYTVRWLEHTLQFKNIDSYHGTGALNYTLFPEWDSLFVDLANRDTEEIVFEVKRRPSGHKRGWSHQNNYIDSIGSSSDLAPSKSSYSSNKSSSSSKGDENESKTMSVRRRGVTGSYLESLNRMSAEKKDDSKRGNQKFLTPWKPGQTQDSSKLRSEHIDEPVVDSEGSDSDRQSNRSEDPQYVEHIVEIDPTSILARIVSVREHIAQEWKEDLDTLVLSNDMILEDYESMSNDDVIVGKDKAMGIENKGRTVGIYNHSAMEYLTNAMTSRGQDCSPFRRANFDLLLMLSTQEALHRVLSGYSKDSDDVYSEAKHSMLNDFYKANVGEYFDGHQYGFGRTDRFFEALLLEPPIARDGKDGSLHLIRPLSLIEDILRERSTVAREWKSIIALAPDEHLDLRRILFTKQLMEMDEWNVDIISPNSEGQSSIEQVFGPGFFE